MSIFSMFFNLQPKSKFQEATDIHARACQDIKMAELIKNRNIDRAKHPLGDLFSRRACTREEYYRDIGQYDGFLPSEKDENQLELFDLDELDIINNKNHG